MELQFKNKTLDLDCPKVMGILNVTPDSFSDGGLFAGKDSAIRQVERMLLEGASIIDVGGESTRPGAQAVSEDEELARVIPIVEAIRNSSDVVISIDTSKPSVMKEAVAAGADMVNDVNALQADGAEQVCADLAVPVCLMHMQGQPRTMQKNPCYDEVVDEVASFFENRVDACEKSGISRRNILLDPGFGFGKTLQHNLELLKNLDRFHVLGCPLLVGLSRKSMLGTVTGRVVEQRLAGSVAGAVISAMNGAKILRVHDVAETVDAMKLVYAAQLGEGFNG